MYRRIKYMTEATAKAERSSPSKCINHRQHDECIHCDGKDHWYLLWWALLVVAIVNSLLYLGAGYTPSLATSWGIFYWALIPVCIFFEPAEAGAAKKRRRCKEIRPGAPGSRHLAKR